MTKLQMYKYLMYKPMTRINLIGFILTMTSFLVWYDFWNENVLGVIFLVVFVMCAILFAEYYMARQISESWKAKGVDYQEPIYINKVIPTANTVFQLLDGSFTEATNIINDRMVEVHYCNDSDSYRKVRVFIPESRYRHRNSYSVNGEFIRPITLGLIDEIVVPPQGVYAVFGEVLGWYEVQDGTSEGDNETTR